MTRREQKKYAIYIGECLISAIIGFSIYHFYPVIGAWCLFSIILVISPDKKDAMVIAANRIKANLIGALVGLGASYFHNINMLIICISITLSMIICEWFNLKAATKSAVVAVLIITMHEKGNYFWNIALERAGGVMLGCMIGLSLTYIFHFVKFQSRKTIEKIKEVHRTNPHT